MITKREKLAVVLMVGVGWLGLQAVTAEMAFAQDSDAKELDQELLNMSKVRDTYTAARKVLGGEHILLSPLVYASKSCAGTRLKLGDDACEVGKWTSGVAGMVTVPLWGAGGGHGMDGFPVLQTEDDAQVFKRFSDSV